MKKEQNTPSYYAIIPANVRYDNSLAEGAKLMYGEVTALSNTQGYCNASNGYFAKLYGRTPQCISKWINQLKRAGHVVIKEIKHKPGQIERRIFLSASMVSTIIEGVSTTVKGVSTIIDQNNTSINIKEKEEKENFIQEIPDLKQRIGKPLVGALTKVAESEENLTRLESMNECGKFELLLQWLEYRNDRKKNLTAKGILILVTKFEQFDNEAISIAIEKSIESNYTGLFIKPVQKQPVQQPNEPPKDAQGNEIKYKPQGDLKGYAKILAFRDKLQAQKAAQ